MPELKRLVYLTAGAAGMYCGSCLQDNAMARELIAQGIECLLVPVYTPIRVDGENVSQSRVFLGGINVYLEQRWSWFRKLPSSLTRWLDHPWVLRVATKWAGGVDANHLGALAESVMQGMNGAQQRETAELCDWLAKDIKPDAVILTNLLIGGCLPVLKSRLSTRVCVYLQGDDLFLDFLPPDYRERCLTQLRRLAREVDVFITHTQFYAKKMAELYDIPLDRFEVIPLSIDSKSLFPESRTKPSADAPLRIGYLARLAPEKGLHYLVDAFIQLKQDPRFANAELHIAGWLGPQHRPYAEQQWQKLKLAGLEPSFKYHGSPDLESKKRFLQSLDVLSVPTTMEEPKGLYVLEALAAGVAVVQPKHGAFPELLKEGLGGKLVPPFDASALAEGLGEILSDRNRLFEMGTQGRQFVHQSRTQSNSAQQLVKLLQSP